MDINASIVDQRLQGIIDEHGIIFEEHTDLQKKKSLAFVLLCVSTALDISPEESSDYITDGGNDVGVDAMHIGDADDGEFTVSLFQGKYKTDLTGNSNFPESEIQKIINTLGVLFDPSKVVQLNEKIRPKVEEIRSRIRDGEIPNIRVILCNNGKKWNTQAENWIKSSGFPEDQVSWTHFNHDNIVSVLQRRKSVDDSLRFEGKAIIDEFNFKRVLIGKVPVTEIASLFDRHDDLLLERNIRRYLGLHSNRVNASIHDTLMDENKRSNFYFFNNGITVICRQFRHNALQGENYQVKLEGLQIINGGQTCKTIQQTLNNPNLFSQFDKTFVLVRIYELSDDEALFIRDITYATNSQNPVDLRDLHSNDKIQTQLEIGIKDLGYTYKRQRAEGESGPNVITSLTVAESALAIWRKKPHQAKFRRKEHFGKLYDDIFSTLTAAQAVLGVLIFRFVENERKRPTTETPPQFLPYASHYLAMLTAVNLCKIAEVLPDNVAHNNLKTILTVWDNKKESLYKNALEEIKEGIAKLYGNREDISLQQYSATFRRGDLLENLRGI